MLLDEVKFHMCHLFTVQADPLYIGIFVSSMLFPALASIVKEKIFSDAKVELEGQSLDIFVVNSFGSGAQALGVLLLLPVLVSQRGLSLTELPQYVGDGTPSLLSVHRNLHHALQPQATVSLKLYGCIPCHAQSTCPF